MHREVPGDPGAGTSSYWVMLSNTATKISMIFRDRVITELIYLLISAAMVSMMFRRLIWIHFFYHFLAIRLYHEFLSQLNCHFDRIFRTLLSSDNNSSKTSQWNIMKFYLPTLKHLVIQLAKLQIYTLNLTTTSWHCKIKIPLLLNRSVHVCTRIVFSQHNSLSEIGAKGFFYQVLLC